MESMKIKRVAAGVGEVSHDGKVLGNVYKTSIGWRHGHSFCDYPTRKIAAENLVDYLVFGAENEI